MKNLETLPEDDDVLERLAIQDEGRVVNFDLSDTPVPEPVLPNLILLPNDHYTFSESARHIFTRLAKTDRYFVRGVVVELLDGALNVLTAAAFRSRLDRLGLPLMAYIKLENGDLALRPKRCSRDSAEALLATLEARERLQKIRIVTRSAVIVRGHDNAAVVLGPGYHSVAGGFLVTANAIPSQVALPDAMNALRGLLIDFDFASPGDESRAFAALVTPALRMGGWLHEHCPIDIAEANESQAGKTLRQRLCRAIYSENAYQIARRDGGVGSVDESLGTALLSGKPFIAFDNFRGRLDSQFLESVLTWGSSVSVRVPHRGEVQVDASAVTFQISSNGVETTRDLANRSSICRIRKRPPGYVFHQWPEGDLISHIEARSTYYLGAVFSVVRAWADSGMPRLDGGFHDFREWSGVLNWMVVTLFGAAPLLDGHESAQTRVSNPAMTWLRAVCLAAERSNQLGQTLSASSFAELCENEGIELPGLRSPADDQARKHVGKLFARCYQSSETPDSVTVDGFIVNRTEFVEHDQERRRDVTVRRYQISALRARRAQ